MGRIFDVFPYTAQNAKYVEQSRLFFSMEGALGRSARKIDEFLPEDYSTATALYRALDELLQRKCADDIERIRTSRIAMWDAVNAAGFTGTFRFNNPHEADWDKHPDDTDFGTDRIPGSLHSQFSGTKYLKPHVRL